MKRKPNTIKKHKDTALWAGVLVAECTVIATWLADEVGRGFFLFLLATSLFFWCVMWQEIHKVLWMRCCLKLIKLGAPIVRMAPDGKWIDTHLETLQREYGE